jgi:hypothetical protein
MSKSVGTGISGIPGIYGRAFRMNNYVLPLSFAEGLGVRSVSTISILPLLAERAGVRQLYQNRTVFCIKTGQFIQMKLQ